MKIYKNDFLNIDGTKEEKSDYVIDNFYELCQFYISVTSFKSFFIIYIDFIGQIKLSYNF